MTARERWKALHHARRAFRRDQMLRLEQLVKIEVPAHYAARHWTHIEGLMLLITNPPIFYDPKLPGA